MRERLLELIKETVKGVIDRLLLDLPPHGLDGIQVGRIRRQLDELQPLFFGDEIIHVVCPVSGGIIHDDVNFRGIGIFLEDGDQKSDEAVRIQPVNVLEMTLSGERINDPEHVQLGVFAVDRQGRGLALPCPPSVRDAGLIKGALVLKEHDLPFVEV